MYSFPKQTFNWLSVARLNVRLCDSMFALLLIHFVSVHAQPSTDTSESWVGRHIQREHTLAEEICEKEGELGQEVTRVSSIAAGMERCVPRCEASQDEAKLRAAGHFCAWWLAADVLSWPVNMEDWVFAQGKRRGGERQRCQKKLSDL